MDECAIAIARSKASIMATSRPTNETKGKVEYSINSMRGVVSLNIRLEADTRQDGADWIATCPALDVSSQGATKAEALASLQEAVELWFESCLQRGVLDGALREAGFIGGRNEEIPPGATNVVELRAHPAGGQTTPDYIEITVPAYIAAQHLETSAPC
jgi:predicted RNase H-like HicB family nuclease